MIPPCLLYFICYIATLWAGPQVMQPSEPQTAPSTQNWASQGV